MIKAILLDLDGTLLNRSASIEPFLRSQIERNAAPTKHVDFSAFHRRYVELDMSGYTPRLQVYQSLIEDFDLDGTAESWVDDHREHFCEHSVTFPGVAETLSRLREDGYKLAIVTNGSTKSQWAKIAVSGFDRMVDESIISEREGVWKPDPAIFELTAKRLNVSCSECLFIGDHPVNDVAGAQTVGMTGVWFKGDLPWPVDSKTAPDYTIHNFDELIPIVDKLGKKQNDHSS